MPETFSWNWFLHASGGNSAPAGAPLSIGNRRSLQPLTAPPGIPFRLTFEQICARLQPLPRLFIEPDGSFVWRHDGIQLDGQINDGAAGCMDIQIKGRPTPATWNGLLDAVDWPRQEIVIQLVELGVFVSAEEFRGMWAAVTNGD